MILDCSGEFSSSPIQKNGSFIPGASAETAPAQNRAVVVKRIAGMFFIGMSDFKQAEDFVLFQIGKPQWPTKMWINPKPFLFLGRTLIPRETIEQER